MVTPTTTSFAHWTECQRAQLAARAKAALGIAAEATHTIIGTSPEWMNALISGASFELLVTEPERAPRQVSILCFDQACRVQERVRVERVVRLRTAGPGCGGEAAAIGESYDANVGDAQMIHVWDIDQHCQPYSPPLTANADDTCTDVEWSWAGFFSGARVCYAASLTDADQARFTALFQPAAAYVSQMMRDRFELAPPYDRLAIVVHPQCVDPHPPAKTGDEPAPTSPDAKSDEKDTHTLAQVYGHQMEVLPLAGPACAGPIFAEDLLPLYEEALAHELVHNYTSPLFFDADRIFDEALATYVQLQYRGAVHPNEAAGRMLVYMPLPAAPVAPVQVLSDMSTEIPLFVDLDGVAHKIIFRGCESVASKFVPGGIMCRFFVDGEKAVGGVIQGCARATDANLMLCVEPREDTLPVRYDAKVFSLAQTVQRSLVDLKELTPGKLRYSRANVVWDGERVYADFDPVYNSLPYAYPVPGAGKSVEHYVAGFLVLTGIEQYLWLQGADPDALPRAFGARVSACLADIGGCPQFVEHLPALTGLSNEEWAPLLEVLVDPSQIPNDIRICHPSRLQRSVPQAPP